MMRKRRLSKHLLRSHRARRVLAALGAMGLLTWVGCGSGTDSPANADSSIDHSAPARTVAATSRAVPGVADPADGQPVVDPLPEITCAASDCHQDLFRVAYRHAPVQAGACDSCHEDEQPEHRFPQKRAGTQSCTFCHPVVGHQEHLHQAIEQEGCLTCHDPHGSNAKFLLTAPSTELTCQKCHQVQRKSHLHGPFASGQCTACHQPHESNNKFLLVGGEGQAHCLVCHREKAELIHTAQTVHEPMEDDCGACHEAHSSDFAGLLIAPIEELCFACHTAVAELVVGAASPHDAVLTGQRCANCHDSHANDRPALLRDEPRQLCLGCHDQRQTARDGRTIPDMRPALLQRKSLHGPVRTGQCSACHETHGAPNARLLRQPYPPEFYTSFDLTKYALCFECHNSAAVLSERTTRDTNFRDGDRNLHYLHVNRAEKGRTCRTCHEVHGSDLPRHMASAVPFEDGGWTMPIGFQQTETGGRCSPGCHGPEEYRRRPVPLAPLKTNELDN